MKRLISMAVVAVGAAAVGFGLSSPAVPVAGAPEPANKVAVSANTVDRIGLNDKDVTLLETSFKASSPTDLMVQLSAECALFTKVKSGGTDSAEAKASVEVWAELDGKAVAISPNARDDGRVVLCNRALGLSTTNLALDQFIEIFIRGRQANAFNWVALNVGSGSHTLKILGDITTGPNTGVSDAEAGVGKRTLIVEPFKAPTGFTF